MVKIKVPATSANLGPGFDSLGVALQLYNFFTIEEIESGVHIEILPDNNAGLLTDKTNLVYLSVKKFYEHVGLKLNGLRIIIENNIPVGRGLGSSSTAIVGGIAAANALSGMNLDKRDLFRLATEVEGHPDNVGPAIFGGFTICYKTNEGFEIISQKPADNIKPILLIPSEVLETKKARGVLPERVSMKDAVFNISHACILVDALINGKAKSLKEAMKDRLHQPYRAPLIKGFEELVNEINKIPDTGVALSGAGPSIICLTSYDLEEKIIEEINGIVLNLNLNYQIHPMNFDTTGYQVFA